MRDCTARAKSISSGRVVTGRVVSRRVGAGGGCPERKGAATRVASPFSSPATPLSRAAPPPPPEGGPRRAERIGSVRFAGSARKVPQDIRLHRAVLFCCRSYLVRLCREQLLLAWQSRCSVLGTCRLADAAGLQREGLSCRTQDGFVAEHSAFYNCTQETDGTVDVPGIAKSIR